MAKRESLASTLILLSNALILLAASSVVCFVVQPSRPGAAVPVRRGRAGSRCPSNLVTEAP